MAILKFRHSKKHFNSPVLLFFALYKVVLIFEPKTVVIQCDSSNDYMVLFVMYVMYGAQGDSLL